MLHPPLRLIQSYPAINRQIDPVRNPLDRVAARVVHDEGVVILVRSGCEEGPRGEPLPYQRGKGVGAL